jgi:hypothetical protein
MSIPAYIHTKKKGQKVEKRDIGINFFNFVKSIVAIDMIILLMHMYLPLPSHRTCYRLPYYWLVPDPIPAYLQLMLHHICCTYTYTVLMNDFEFIDHIPYIKSFATVQYLLHCLNEKHGGLAGTPQSRDIQQVLPRSTRHIQSCI